MSKKKTNEKMRRISGSKLTKKDYNMSYCPIPSENIYFLEAYFFTYMMQATKQKVECIFTFLDIRTSEKLKSSLNSHLRKKNEHKSLCYSGKLHKVSFIISTFHFP